MRAKAAINIALRALRGALSITPIIIVYQVIPALVPWAYEAAGLAGIDVGSLAAAFAALIFISVAAAGTPLGCAASIARSILILYLTVSLTTINLTIYGMEVEVDAGPLLMIAAASALIDLARVMLSAVERYALKGEAEGGAR